MTFRIAIVTCFIVAFSSELDSSCGPTEDAVIFGAEDEMAFLQVKSASRVHVEDNPQELSRSMYEEAPAGLLPGATTESDHTIALMSEPPVPGSVGAYNQALANLWDSTDSKGSVQAYNKAAASWAAAAREGAAQASEHQAAAAGSLEMYNRAMAAQWDDAAHRGAATPASLPAVPGSVEAYTQQMAELRGKASAQQESVNVVKSAYGSDDTAAHGNHATSFGGSPSGAAQALPRAAAAGASTAAPGSVEAYNHAMSGLWDRAGQQGPSKAGDAPTDGNAVRQAFEKYGEAYVNPGGEAAAADAQGDRPFPGIFPKMRAAAAAAAAVFAPPQGDAGPIKTYDAQSSETANAAANAPTKVDASTQGQPAQQQKTASTSDTDAMQSAQEHAISSSGSGEWSSGTTAQQKQSPFNADPLDYPSPSDAAPAMQWSAQSDSMHSASAASAQQRPQGLKPFVQEYPSDWGKGKGLGRSTEVQFAGRAPPGTPGVNGQSQPAGWSVNWNAAQPWKSSAAVNLPPSASSNGLPVAGGFGVGYNTTSGKNVGSDLHLLRIAEEISDILELTLLSGAWWSGLIAHRSNQLATQLGWASFLMKESPSFAKAIR
eukprot:gnl/TRDRNA2_/TRDRNA2_149484_c0_seq2.p1 gnl/TRDRNA2_/TRDRNA2_149484_c0~~gnl/TRDRNA2_/TRDRNA2_149484_c0_seq2.p1  ORF type:complete len:602 (+),score=91.10 gnl/TRDRNA2_/TRDRNA2_149484_c0_seq2:66-1871(+)